MAKWYDKFRLEIKDRDEKCRLAGMNHVYKRDSADELFNFYEPPHTMKDDRTFKTNKPFDLKKNCTLWKPPLNTTDPQKRYYNQVTDKKGCDHVKGFWEENVVNRANRYDRGTCFVTESDAHCAKKYEVPELLTNEHLENRDKVIIDTKDKCNKDAKCSWLKMSKTYDCISQRAKNNIEGVVTDIPEAMPKNITKDNIEDYLTEWYNNRTEDTPPKTNDLLPSSGDTRNRCKPPQKANEEVKRLATQEELDKLKDSFYSIQFDPRKKENIRLISQYVPFWVYKEILNRWNYLKSVDGDIEKMPEHYKNDILAPYMKLKPVNIYDLDPRKPEDYKILDMDFGLPDHVLQTLIKRKNGLLKDSRDILAPYAPRQDLRDEDDLAAQDNGKSFPSIPQSLVNMIMKNLAKPDNKNRGLMCIHSTGSGKTITSVGIMEAFWETDRQIIYASSIEAISSNPDTVFHMGAYKIFNRFARRANGYAIQQPPYTSSSEKEALGKIGQAFRDRGVMFQSFAKLANRIEKTEKFKLLLKKQLGGLAPKKRSTLKTDLGLIIKNSGKQPGALIRQPSKEELKKRVIKASATKKPLEEKQKPLINNKKAVTKILKKSNVNQNQRYTKQTKELIPKPRKEVVISDETPMGRLVHRVARFYNLRPFTVKQWFSQCNIHDSDDFIDLDNSILIIDEIQQVFKPLANQKEKHKIVEKHLDPRMHPGLKLAILSATPGDTVEDVIKLLNAVRDPGNPPISVPNIDNLDEMHSFKKDIRGLISYFDMSSDLTKFPKLIDEGPNMYPMSKTQFAKYLEAYKELKESNKDFEKLAKANQLNKFYQGPRKYANMLFNFDKSLSLSEFSSKLPALIDNITNRPTDKHYCYSAFYENRGTSQGILEIARQLENIGYKKLTIKEAIDFNKRNVIPPVARRFILATTKELGEEGSSKAGQNLSELLKIYNMNANKNGELIHVMLASNNYNASIDLKAVKHIHLFEPLVSMAMDKQALGRAVRYCSFSDFDDTREWVVEVHRYFSSFPVELESSGLPDTSTLYNELSYIESQIADLKGKTRKDPEAKARSDALKNDLKNKKKAYKDATKSTKAVNLTNIKNIDEFIYQESKERMRELFVLYEAMMQAAIDCKLLSKFHSATGKQIKCENFSTSIS